MAAAAKQKLNHMTLIFFLILIIATVASARATGMLSGGTIWLIVWTAMFSLFFLLGAPYYVPELFQLKVLLIALIFPSAYFLTYFLLNIRHHSFYTITAQCESHSITTFITLAALPSFASAIFFSYSHGFSLSEAINPLLFIENSSSFAAQIFSEGIERNLMYSIASAFGQSALAIAGLGAGLKIPIPKKIIYLAFLGPFIFAVVTTKRSDFLVSMTCFIAAYLSGRYLLYRSVRSIFSTQMIATAFALFLVIIIFIIGTHWIRLSGNPYNSKTAEDAIEHMRPWVAGYLPSFYGWYMLFWDGDYTYGASLFRGLMSNIGLAEGSGLSERSEAIPISNYQTSNASTVLKFLVRDFGLFGASVFIAILGMISAISARLIEKGSVQSALFFSFCICIITWSPNSWYFGYGSRVISAVISVIAVIVIFNSRQRIRRFTITE